MSNCPINGRAINTLFPINGCEGAILEPPEKVVIGCYYSIKPECRDYVTSTETQIYTIPSCESRRYTIPLCENRRYIIPACGCDPAD